MQRGGSYTSGTHQIINRKFGISSGHWYRPGLGYRYCQKRTGFWEDAQFSMLSSRCLPVLSPPSTPVCLTPKSNYGKIMRRLHFWNHCILLETQLAKDFLRYTDVLQLVGRQSLELNIAKLRNICALHLAMTSTLEVCHQVDLQVLTLHSSVMSSLIPVQRRKIFKTTVLVINSRFNLIWWHCNNH